MDDATGLGLKHPEDACETPSNSKKGIVLPNNLKRM
jgi:hypothetical protein